MLRQKHLCSCALAAFAFANGANGAPILFSGSGANSAAIQSAVDAFRTSLGTLNANVAGSFSSGRREVNWDGVPDTASAPNSFPANFFNVNSPRGVVFSTPGTGFQVSANQASGTPIEFGNIDPGYPGIFGVFSPPRLFTALGSTITDVNFFVPGSTTAATTNAFGAVFTHVTTAGSTTLQFFDPLGASLGTFNVPNIAGNETLSFLGVSFNAGERVGRVRVTSGSQVLAAGNLNAVAMDDFIYAEPNAVIPEPGTLLLFSAGIMFLGARRLRRS